MKTNAIFTRTLTTSTISAFDLVKQGWQIISVDVTGVITATKQEVVSCYKDTVMSNMMLRNLYDSQKSYGTEIISKIDFGVYMMGFIWNAENKCAETFMNRPVISDISSVIPKEDEDDGFDFYISNENLEAAEAWDSHTSREFQDSFFDGGRY